MSIAKNIKEVFDKYKRNFLKRDFKKNEITIYEKSFGFSEETRKGSRPFCNVFGKFMEEIWLSSGVCIKTKKSSFDAESDTHYYQFKTKYNTMNQGSAFSSIQPMIERSIKDNKKFFIVILVDSKERSRNIGHGLTKLKHITGYDPEKFRWISDELAYEHFFGNKGKIVKKIICNFLTSLSKHS